MRTLVEITQELEEPDDEGNIQYSKSRWWLLHWGLENKTIEMDKGQIIPVSYTVAICENYESGQVQTFLPDQIRIIGKQI